ncbi:BTAD domain-containing putative transcriptional regulator [Actinopolymorpha sp. B17G11]|uniref:ATP-binding protein n=1 Tax=Actinopolymorpha sp. B17G11 TaxID=3160861 RepID=UPI0032E4E8AD
MSVELVLLSRVAFRDQEVSGPRLCGLLALLAGDLRTGCGTTRLVEGLWPHERPANPAKAVQILVSRARALLGPEVVARTPTGYRLALGEDQIDATVVLLCASAGAQQARAGHHEAALAHAEEGLAQWKSPPSGNHGVDAPGLDDPVAALRVERAVTYRTLVRIHALALARLGRRAEALEPLADLARDRPRDEEILLELIRCEAAVAGTSAALDRYEAYRRALRDDLGTDPGPALRAEHQQLLRGEAPLVRHGVPHEPNPLLGRAADVAEVAKLVRTSRVTSIVGPGGLGKTRLAYVVGREAEQRVVHAVALAGLTAAADVAGEVASALGVGESRRTTISHLSRAQDVVTGIVEALGPDPALLVLDNCEHVIGGVARLVEALVSRTRDLRVLTTSRAPLGLSSESVYLLPELDLSATVELFEHRARAARPGVDLPAEAVEELCRRLDGLPLAAELAAARVRVMTVAEIAVGLKDRFSLLRGGSRDAPARHHTLRAVVDWSWDLLGPSGRAAMRALSVFPNGFTADAARHVLAGSEGDGDVLQVVEHLVDQSLLKVTDTSAGTRFSMLETMREFSAAERESAGETDRAVDGFLAWARRFGISQHDSVFGADVFTALERVRVEQDNLVQALRHAVALRDRATIAATAAVLGGLWTIEANYKRLRTLSEETAWDLSHYRPEPDLVEVTRTALTLCCAYTFLVEGPRPVRSLVAARRLPPAPPDSLVRAVAVVLNSIEDPSDLHALCDSAEPYVAGVANAVATYVWENMDDPDKALTTARRMVEAFDRENSPWLWGLAHARVSELCLQAEQAAEVQLHLRTAMPVAERIGLWPDVVGMRWWMALAALQLGDLDEAEHWLETTPQWVDAPLETLTYGHAVRAEILLARGEVEAGLRMWRRTVERLVLGQDPMVWVVTGGMDPWTLEAKSVTVVAHGQHGRLDLVKDLAEELSQVPPGALVHPSSNPSPFLVELPIIGALLVALAMVDFDRGRRTGNDLATISGVRLIALAERFRFLRGFAPTMSSARIRALAEQADGSAYADAVSSYADLDREGLRAAAVEVLRARDHL